MPLGITIISISLNHEYDARLYKDVSFFVIKDIIVLYMQCNVDAHYYVLPSYWVLYCSKFEITVI
jgi:hypothetical protein